MITIQLGNCCTGGSQRTQGDKDQGLCTQGGGEPGKAQLPDKEHLQKSLGEGICVCIYLFLLLTVVATVTSFLLFE